MTWRWWIASLWMVAMVLLGSVAEASGQERREPWAPGGPSRAQDLKIELVIFGPGDDIATWWGHAAMAVSDQRLGVQRIYNYGMFSFDETLVPKFVSGRLEFWVGAADYHRTLRAYARENRDVHLLELDLSPERRLAVARELADDVLPENRHYLYHHYDDNCSTRIRDLVDLATEGAFSRAARATPAHQSLRDHTRRHAQHLLLELGMMFAMNGDIDRPISAWEEMFLASELERQALRFELTDPVTGTSRPLVRRTRVFHEASERPPPPALPPRRWPWLLLLGGALGVISLALARWLRRAPGPRRRLPRALFGLYHGLLGLLVGLAGVLSLFLWTTDHTVAHHNENLLLASPLALLALPLGLCFVAGRARRWLPALWLMLTAMALAALVLEVLPGFEQRNVLTMALLVPMHLGAAAAMIMVGRGGASGEDTVGQQGHDDGGEGRDRDREVEEQPGDGEGPGDPRLEQGG